VLAYIWQIITGRGVVRSREPFKFWWAPTISYHIPWSVLSNSVLPACHHCRRGSACRYDCLCFVVVVVVNFIDNFQVQVQSLKITKKRRRLLWNVTFPFCFDYIISCIFVLIYWRTTAWWRWCYYKLLITCTR